MRRLPYAELDALSRWHNAPQELDVETEVVYVTIHGERYYATLPPVAESPAPMEQSC